MQERNLCSQVSSKITAVLENQRNWLLLTFTRFLADIPYKRTTKLKSNILKLNSLSQKVLNISSEEYKLYQNHYFVWYIIRSCGNEHYYRNCEHWGLPLRISSAVLHRSHEARFPLKRLYFSSPKLLLLRLALERHLEFKYIFLQKGHNKLTLTSMMRTWRIGGIKGMSPGSATLSPPQTTSRFASLPDFFSPTPIFFSFIPNAEPDTRLSQYSQGLSEWKVVDVSVLEDLHDPNYINNKYEVSKQ